MVREVGVVVVIGEGERAETLEDVDVGIETDNDGDARTYERVAASLTPGNVR